MQKSIIIKKHGGPEVLELEKIKLDSPGPNEIRVKNLAIGLNYIDTYHRSGLYPVKLPSGIGLEGSGVVEEVGSNVKIFKIGDNIAVKLPKGISHKIAASIMTKGLTAFYLLNKTYKANTRDTVLFHAAAGGVGQIFTQWAKSIGCKVIGTVGSKHKIDVAKKNGCDFVINYNEEDFDKKVLEITNNNGVDVVYDGVGKDTFEKSINCLKIRGMMVSFGNASGPLNPIDVPKLIQPKGLFFTRPSMGQYLKTQDQLEEASKSLFEKINFGKVKIKIFKEYPLNEVQNAHRDLESRKIIGPSILIPNG